MECAIVPDQRNINDVIRANNLSVAFTYIPSPKKPRLPDQLSPYLMLRALRVLDDLAKLVEAATSLMQSYRLSEHCCIRRRC
jgi:hypothetical protein